MAGGIVNLNVYLASIPGYRNGGLKPHVWGSEIRH